MGALSEPSLPGGGRRNVNGEKEIKCGENVEKSEEEWREGRERERPFDLELDSGKELQ